MNNQQSQLIQQAEEIKKLRDALEIAEALLLLHAFQSDDGAFAIYKKSSPEWAKIEKALNHPATPTYGIKALAVVEAAIKTLRRYEEHYIEDDVIADLLSDLSEAEEALQNLQGGE